MGVIRGDVVLLRIGIAEPFAREEEEFDDLDIRRQRLGMQRLGVIQIGVPPEQPVYDGSDKSPFEIGRWRRLLKRQRRENGQMDRAVIEGTPKQRIDDVIRFTETQWQTDHQLRSDRANDIVRDRLGVGEDSWHRMSADPLRRTGHRHRARDALRHRLPAISP